VPAAREVRVTHSRHSVDPEYRAGGSGIHCAGANTLFRGRRQFDLAVAALDSNMKLAAPYGTWTDWHNLGTAYRNLGLMWVTSGTGKTKP
jgi:hypothetical protein